ncbi:hypothetical protein TNCV_4827951 [Trichonephila clavipes]|uniref:Uncharacterized protein n=1 Tax=Trichonephila clavipes TaxID=2585209 RepID=A0A8X6SJL5_TRICX|nr:hypothetical protein TNCV_4827951 [Trichonephila clavipes]
MASNSKIYICGVKHSKIRGLLIISFYLRRTSNLIILNSRHVTVGFKVTDSWPTCHEFKPSSSEDPPCRVAMHVKSVEAQTSSRRCGVEARRVPTQVSSSSLDHLSKLRSPSLKALE